MNLSILCFFFWKSTILLMTNNLKFDHKAPQRTYYHLSLIYGTNLLNFPGKLGSLHSTYPRALKRCGTQLFQTNSLPMSFCPNSWINSYLSNRRTSVAFIDSNSDFHLISADIHQGSVHAPTLFLLHKNNLLYSTSRFSHSYADEGTLHASLQYKSHFLQLR